MCRVQTHTGWHTAFRWGHVIIEWMSLLNYNITPALDSAVLHVPVVDTFRRVQNMMTGRIYGRPFCQQIIRITNETGKRKNDFTNRLTPPPERVSCPQEPPDRQITMIRFIIPLGFRRTISRCTSGWLKGWGIGIAHNFAYSSVKSILYIL